MEIEFTNNVDEILAALNSAAVVTLEQCGLLTEGYAKKLCPVDTGNLRNSITHTVDADANRPSNLIARLDSLEQEVDNDK